MKRINQKQADELLTHFFNLRNKRIKSKNKKIQQEYSKIKSLCVSEFDYLVELKARKYKKFANYDDLKQDGRIALLSALNNFDPSKGSFFHWANQYIKTKISREANRHSTMKIPIKQTKHTQPFKVSQLPIIIDNAPNALENIERDEIKKMIHSALDKLPNDQKKIIELNGIKSHSISQISRELKISRSDCIKLLNEAKKNLKTQIESLNS